MKAAVFQGLRDIRCTSAPAPEISAPDQLVVAVEATSICGSDLFLYDGPFDAALVPGKSITGHEIVGRIVDVGADVTRFRKGDRITAPFTVSCHHCAMCSAGQTALCETTHGAVYGFGLAAGDLGGSHAEAMLIHRADENALLLPEDLDAADALTLSCNLPSALIGVEASALGAGESVAIVGCGPTALMALDIVLLRDPAKVVVLDRLGYRLALASVKGAISVDIDSEGWLERALAETNGRGFDRVIEVVGSPESLQTAFSLVRPGGTVSGLGVFSAPEMTINPSGLSLRNISVCMNGAANVATVIERSLELLRNGKVSPREYFTHTFALDDIDQAFSLFSNRTDDVVKVLVRP